MSDAPNIVFLGTHGQHNIGDELLLETFLHHLGPRPSYVVNTYDKEFTAAQVAGRYRVELIDTAGDRLALLKHLRRADVVVFGGGSIIKELYASVGRNRYATMAMILAIVVFAKWIARAPIAMLNIGVGPIQSAPGRWLARLILGQVDLLTVRDPGSYALCRSIGVDASRVKLGTDAVFSVTGEWLLGAEPSPSLRPAGGPLRIALNLNFDIENPDNWEHFQTELAAALRDLAARHDLEIHGLPMQSRGKERDDATILRSFAARSPEVRFVEHDLRSPADVARLINGCDLLVSERLHAIVMAAILGVPAFVLAYDVKVRELASTLGLDESCLDISGPFQASEVERGIEALLEDPRAAGERLQSRAAQLGRQAVADLAASSAWVLDRAS